MQPALLLAVLGIVLPAMAATPGLLIVLSKPTHPELTDAQFNDWYSNEHVQDMVKSGLTDLVLRYKNTNSSAKLPYMALYRLPDAAKLSDQKVMGSVPATSPKLPGKTPGSKGGAYKDIMDMESRAFRRTQTFEGQIEKAGRAKALVTSAMQPADGADADFDDWYRKQHLDMLSMLKDYRRSSRYQKLDGSSPKYLAIHEMDSNTAAPEMKIIMGTEWAKKIRGGAKASELDRWEFISEYGTGTIGEKF